MPEKASGSRSAALSRDDVTRLASAAREGAGASREAAALECIIALSAVCGLRYGEIAALTEDAVDIDHGVIRVRRHLTANGEIRVPATPSTVRDVPLPLQIADMIRAFLQTHRTPSAASLVFCDRSGQPWQAADFDRSAWLPLVKRVGLPEDTAPYFHSLRAYCLATLAVTMPAGVVAKVAGHARAA